MNCQTPDCTRKPRPFHARCDACLLRLLRGAFGTEPEPRKPEWLRRGSFNRDITGLSA